MTCDPAGEHRLFQLACSTKARPRQVDLELPVRSEESHPAVPLPFTLVSASDGGGIFVSHVSVGTDTSKPLRACIILAVNGIERERQRDTDA